MKRSFLWLAVIAACCMQADELFNNGPFVTHSGAGFGGADVSAIQNSLGSNLPGYGVQLRGANRLGDDFTVPSGGWQVDTITFYTYQTNSGTTSTMTDFRLQIWNGRPDEPGSHVVWGDLVTNRLRATAFTGTYRAAETNLTANNRPIMSNVISVNATFLPGTYWLDWSADGTMATGPHAPAVTRQGQPGTGNALQFSGNLQMWQQAFDNGGVWQDDFPFVIVGTAAGSLITVPATSMQVNPGIVLSGGLPQLAGSDDSYLVLRPGIVLSSLQRPISVVLEGNAPSSSAATLKIVIESRANQPNINQRVEAYNFVSGNYDPPLDSHNLTTQDVSLQIAVPNAAQHIGAGNLLRMRISFAAAGPVLAYPWQVRMDEATWRVSPD